MNNKRIYPVYFIFPILFIFLVFSFLPGIISIFYSFTDWNSYFKEVNWVGLSNYREIFAGSNTAVYVSYIKNTVVFALVTTLLKTVIGYLLALLLTGCAKGKGIHRTIIFSPQVMSALIVGLVFRAMLHPSTGLLNVVLKAVGLDMLAQSWLTDLRFVFPTVMLVDTWKGVGYIMIIIIAGLQSIPESYYEAAAIDGASRWQRTRNITLPLLIPTFINCTVLNLAYGFRVFDIVYALTGGGPGYSTSVISTAVFKAFGDGNYGMGAALSSILFVFLIGMSYFIIRATEGKGMEDS